MTATAISGRAAGIAAIHALAVWLAEHPEAPVPTYVTMTYATDPRTEVDEATRVAGIRSVAAAAGIEHVIEGDRTVQGERHLMSTVDGDPLTAVYRVAAHKDPHSKRRYV